MFSQSNAVTLGAYAACLHCVLLILFLNVIQAKRYKAIYEPEEFDLLRDPLSNWRLVAYLFKIRPKSREIFLLVWSARMSLVVTVGILGYVLVGPSLP